MNKQPLLIQDAYDFGPPPPKSHETLWEKLYRLFFGDDVFISYARADASRYVPSLAARLAAKKHICFFDQLVADPNEDLPEKLKKKILRSTVFVLIGTKGAVASSFVRKEIELFRRTRRPFIPVDVDGALIEQEGWRDVIGVAKIREDGTRVRSGDPSPEVVNLIKDSFRYTRRSQWLRASLLAGVIVILVAAAGSLLVIRTARAEAAAIERQAASEVDAANKKVSEAEQGLQDIRAEANRLKTDADDARKQAETAATATQAAVTQQKTAEHAMHQAQELERQSAERAAETSRREAGSRAALLSRDPGMEVDALALAVGAAEQSIARQGEIPAQVMNGLTTSALAADYALPLEDTEQVTLTQISSNGEKILGYVHVPRPGSARLVFWDSRTGKRSMSAIEMDGIIGSASFSRDGKRLAAVVGKQQRMSLLVWDLTGMRAKPLQTMCEAERLPLHIELDGDGSHVITFSQEINGFPAVTVCEIASGRKERLTASNGIQSVAFTPEGEPAIYSLTTASDGNILQPVVYFPRSGRAIILKPAVDLRALQFKGFGDDGSVIMIVGGNSEVPGRDSVYIQSPGGDIRRFTGYRGRIISAAFVDGQARVITSSGRVIRLADARSSPNLAALRAHVQGLALAAFSPDGRTVLTVSDDGKGRLWDVQTGRPRHILAITNEFPYGGTSPNSKSKLAAFQADSTRLVTANEEGKIQTWDVNTGRPICPVPGRIAEVTDNLLGMSFLAGGDYVAVAYTTAAANRSFINFLDARTCKLAGTFNFDEQIAFISFSPDGKSMLTSNDSPHVFRLDRPHLKLWNLDGVTPQSGAPIRLASSDIYNQVGAPLSFSFDGTRIETISVDNTGQLWLSVGSSSVRLERWGNDVTKWIFHVFLSADGTRVAALLEKEVRVWDTHSGKLLVVFECDPEVNLKNFVSLSSDGSKLIVAGKDNTVRIYPTSREAFLRAARRLLSR